MLNVSEPGTTEYAPTGYCPKCGYRLDAGVCSECGLSVSTPLRRHPQDRRRRRLIVLFFFLAIAGAGGSIWKFRDDLALHYAPPGFLRWLRGGGGQTAKWASKIWWNQRDLARARELRAKDARISEIKNELVSLTDHPWAGEYEASGKSLWISPNGGYAYHWSTCTAEGWIHGRVSSAREETFSLEPVKSLAPFERLPGYALVPAQWNGLCYLIPESEIVAFANNVNSREVGTPYWYLHRLGKRPNTGHGLPAVAEPYSNMIRSTPLIAQVIGVGKLNHLHDDDSGNCFEVPIMLNAGRSEGVFAGMRLYAIHRDTYLGATVNEVEEHVAKANFVDCLKRDEHVDWPDLFWQFSSLGPFADFFDGQFAMPGGEFPDF